MPSIGADLSTCLKTLSLPSLDAHGRPALFHAGRAAAIGEAQAAAGPGGIPLRSLPKRQFIGLLEARFRQEALDASINALARYHPELSARRVLWPAQAFWLAAAVPILACVRSLAPESLDLVLAAALAAGFVGNAVFRALLVWMGAEPTGGTVAPVVEADLPHYSIIVPLYREANVVPALMTALAALDYPEERLEVLLVAEADDHETLAALPMEAQASHFVVLAVPPASPRTKPKAANYALHFATGEFVVIYDAEDRPEPDQLRKAAAAFRRAPAEVACLQARLNFFNARENILTRMFALDYALWFDFLLPGLDRLAIPMPLGGTSNHFRIEALRAIAGWDPYNVTEDADLGIRLARLGLRTATLESTTYEEATVGLGNWMKQRSRWMKGYMQTWLVHMRNPVDLARHAGLSGFVGFQLFVGGTVLTALLNPLLWCVCLGNLVWPEAVHVPFLASPFAHASAVGLLAGNALFTYLAMLGPYRRGWLDLTPYGVLAPVYWLLISLAAYRGLIELVRRPWHWDKTEHGRTRQTFAIGERRARG